MEEGRSVIDHIKKYLAEVEEDRGRWAGKIRESANKEFDLF